jgi:hypothetical protein
MYEKNIELLFNKKNLMSFLKKKIKIILRFIFSQRIISITELYLSGIDFFSLYIWSKINNGYKKKVLFS